MNIPQSSIEPFEPHGIPIIKMPLMYRYATRQLEVCIGRIEHWLFTGGSEGLTDAQICGHILHDLLHDERDEWLDVNVRSDYAIGGSISLRLQHLKKDISRHVIFIHGRLMAIR